MDGGWLRLIAGLLVLNLLGVAVAAIWIKGSLNQPGPHPVYRFEVPLGPAVIVGPLTESVGAGRRQRADGCASIPSDLASPLGA